ncbi:MAG TPA: GTPase Era [Candidatus Xenobia bacterium]|nr:GTPase Era [Candidatus Xenobia bacterium]
MSFRSGYVAVIGRPNTGKSTLLNALAGTKLAIVSSRPQTTRTRIQAVVNREDAQIILVDTPGIHHPHTRMNEEMMRQVREALEGVDLLLVLVDASRPLNEEDRLAIEAARKFSGPSFLLLNKVDLIAKPALLPLIEKLRREHEFREIIPLSALKGINQDVLERKIVETLPEGPAYFPAETLTDQPLRFMAAEIVREKIFQETRQEVPYATAVVVDKFEEPPEGDERGVARIHATILVERDGQKGILIGAQGQTLKRIGQAAREELEELLGRKVFLELFVKVHTDWRERPGVERLIDWRKDFEG